MAAQKTPTCTVDGIDLYVTRDDVADYDVIRAAATAANEKATDAERLLASVSMAELILGDDHDRVMDELRTRHGGKLPFEVVNDFITQVSETLTAKN